MRRSLPFLVFLSIALAMFAVAWLVPAHLRATNEAVVGSAGRGTPTLVENGLVLVESSKLGPARLLLETAQRKRMPEAEKLGQAITNLSTQRPGVVPWGAPEPPFSSLIELPPAGTNVDRQPLVGLVVRLENREKLLTYLESSRSAAVHTLLRSRDLTNTTIFAPSWSSSGQAFDAAVVVTGLLIEQAKLTPALAESTLALLNQAHRGQPHRFEQLLLDFMSLGQRMDWGQLCEFVSRVPDPETLRLLTALVRRSEPQMPLLFSVVTLSGRPVDVCRYLMDFSQSSFADLERALQSGVGGMNELLTRHQRLYTPAAAVASPAMLGALAWKQPGVAIAVRWVLFLGAGFFLALGVHFLLPRASGIETPLYVRGFHFARETLFALGFLVVVLLAAEPYLSQESQRVEFPFRLRLPVGASVVATANPANLTSFMQQMSLLTLLLFFVLQALIYTACLFKLAEIRRQNLPPRIKLKLLENEEHLFDAGLYLGFVGTIISLIMVSLGVIKPSLMAAYSSTSFGIIFVSVFKIFSLRPAKRRLLMEAEMNGTEPAAGSGRSAFASQP